MMKKNLIEETYNDIILDVSNDVKWSGSSYEKIKYLSTTGKGNFGEKFTTKLLNEIGIDAKIVNGGIGDFDILLTETGITFEHKLATEDTHENFQFNALDKSKNYDYVFCLGISPNHILFDIYPKSEVMKLTTNMTKAAGGYKMTVRKTKLCVLTEKSLKQKLKELFENV